MDITILIADPIKYHFNSFFDFSLEYFFTSFCQKHVKIKPRIPPKRPIKNDNIPLLLV